MTTVPQKAGLEDVIATTSEIALIKGETGELYYRGYSIHDLAEYGTFEETFALLVDGQLPERQHLAVDREELAAARPLPDDVREWIENAAHRFGRSIHPLDALRTVVSMLSLEDPDREDNSRDANRRKAIRLTAQLVTALGVLARVREGEKPLAPEPRGSHAEYLFRSLLGRDPTDVESRAIDVALVLHAEHELNASTFTARVVTATDADFHAAIVAAISALKGPRHGGANEDVIEMLQQIGTIDRVEPFIKAELAAKHRIPGFGHRVYRVLDPRAVHLARLSREVGERSGDTSWYEMSNRVAEVVRHEKGLYANVDFFSATVYYRLGIPTDLYTSIFGCARMAGWSAHIMEQWAHNRLIRPRADYLGPAPKSWVPIELRP